MQVNPVKSKAVRFAIARVKGRIRYYLVDQLIPEASSFNYLGTITLSDLNWGDHDDYTLRKAWKALHFKMCVLKKGNNTKRLAYTALVRPILEYGAECWVPYRGQVSTLNQVQKTVAKFANNVSGSYVYWTVHHLDS
jgi:hypothetical protein